MQLIHEDDELAFMKWKVMESFNPFAGLSKEEISLALTSQFTPVRSKILYLNRAIIFELAEQENGVTFYFTESKKQKEIINAKVDDLQQNLPQVQTPALV